MISKQTRLPIVLSNVTPYHPHYAETSEPTPFDEATKGVYDLLWDEAVTMRHAAQCTECGFIIAAGAVARSRAELQADGLRRFKWCENCDIETLSMVADGRIAGETSIDIEKELAAAEELRRIEHANPGQYINLLIGSVHHLGGVMSQATLAFAADDTLHQRYLNVLNGLKMRMTAVGEAATSQSAAVVAASIVQPAAEEPEDLDHYAIEVGESVESFLDRTGIVTKEGGTTKINLTCLAEFLDIHDDTAMAIAKHPGAIVDVVTAFLKLKRAA